MASDKEVNKFLAEPQNLNSYAYTGNNPIIYVDPNGEFRNPFQNLFSLMKSYPRSIGRAVSNQWQGIKKVAQTILDYTPIGDTSALVKGERLTGEKVGGLGKGLALFGIFGGVGSKVGTNIVSRLSTKIDLSFANSLVRRAEDGFINLYRGVDLNEFEKIMKNGFQTSKFITADISEAMKYFANKGADPKLVKIRMPIEKFTQMIENSGLIQGSHGEEFNMIGDAVREILNKYIIK